MDMIFTKNEPEGLSKMFYTCLIERTSIRTEERTQLISLLADFTEVNWRDDQRKELCLIADGFVTSSTLYEIFVKGSFFNCNKSLASCCLLVSNV